jgi:TPR repeat protein
VPQDYTQAAAWHRKAAEQGLASAQSNLGWQYQKGQGVTQDYAQAALWYRKAAEQGYALAQWNLGTLYKDGQGVPQNYAEAYFWYDLAAAGTEVSLEHPATNGSFRRPPNFH